MEDKQLVHAGRIKLVLALLALSGIFLAQVVGVVFVLFFNMPDSSLWSSIVPELTGAIAAVAAVAMLGGGRLLEPSHEDVSFTFRFGWWCMAISVALMFIELGSYLSEGARISSEWPTKLGECLLYCLEIGVFEEAVFRGVFFMGLLAVMGGTHRGVVRAVFVTSLLFGMAHVDITTDFSDMLSAVQAVLKVTQTGMYSLLLCVIVLRTRRLGGVSLFHGLDDFVIIAPGIVLFNESLDIEYVASGDDAVPTIIYYLFVIALYLPFVIKSLLELRRGQDVWRGAFMDRAVAQAQVQAQERAAAALPVEGGFASAQVPVQMPVGGPTPQAPVPMLVGDALSAQVPVAMPSVVPTPQATPSAPVPPAVMVPTPPSVAAGTAVTPAAGVPAPPTPVGEDRVAPRPSETDRPPVGAHLTSEIVDAYRASHPQTARSGGTGRPPAPKGL